MINQPETSGVRGPKCRRIQLCRKKGWRMPANTVKVDRWTRWGNFSGVGKHSVALFRRDLLNGCAGRSCSVGIEDIQKELRGKNLACWCEPGEPCHADVLLEIANAPEAMR